MKIGGERGADWFVRVPKRSADESTESHIWKHGKTHKLMVEKWVWGEEYESVEGPVYINRNASWTAEEPHRSPSLLELRWPASDNFCNFPQTCNPTFTHTSCSSKPGVWILESFIFVCTTLWNALQERLPFLCAVIPVFKRLPCFSLDGRLFTPLSAAVVQTASASGCGQATRTALVSVRGCGQRTDGFPLSTEDHNRPTTVYLPKSVTHENLFSALWPVLWNMTTDSLLRIFIFHGLRKGTKDSNSPFIY